MAPTSEQAWNNGTRNAPQFQHCSTNDWKKRWGGLHKWTKKGKSKNAEAIGLLRSGKDGRCLPRL